MAPPQAPLLAEPIAIVDAIARAAHRCVRQLEPMPWAEGQHAHAAFVAGLIAGICEELYKEESAEHWVAYAYAHLDGCSSEVLARARAIVAAAADGGHHEHYERGYMEAAAVVTWLGQPGAGP